MSTLVAAGGAAVLMFISHLEIAAQEILLKGEQVMVTVSMQRDDLYTKICTIESFEPLTNSYVVTCDGATYSVNSMYVRSTKRKTADDRFYIGQRVMASLKGRTDEASYQPCVVTRGLRRRSYRVRCDQSLDREFDVRAAFVKPFALECPFNKKYDEVSQNAEPSGTLFQNVIFGAQRLTAGFLDFGLTFLDFKVGDAVTGADKATVYPVKAKELVCQKGTIETLRLVREVEYACSKGETGEWACRSREPLVLERTRISNR